MKKFSKGIKGALAVGAAMAVSISMVPVGTAEALGSLQSWQAPSSKTATTITKDGQTKKLITSASHKATEGTADMLGISNVTCSPNAANPFVWNGTAQEIYYGQDDPTTGAHKSGVSETARFGIYGSDVNEQMNPYYANYFYNAYQNVTGGTNLADSNSVVLMDTTSGNPFTADTNIIAQYGTSAALYYRPDILLGAGASPRNTTITSTASGNTVAYGDALTTTSGYSELVQKIRNRELGSYEGQDLYQAGDENYDPYYVTAGMGSWSSCLGTLYALSDSADAIMAKDSSKTTRYEDPEDITEDFESYILGTQDAVLKAIDEGTVQKKTIAVVTAVDTETNTITLNASGNYGGSDGGVTIGSLENVTTNLADKLGKTEVTAQELMQNADVVYIGAYMGFSNQSSQDAAVAINDKLTAVLKAGGYTDESKYPDTFVQGPKAVIHARMGTVDGASYLGAVIGFAYPEVVDPVDFTAYFYQNFYHVKESRLSDALGLNLASMTLPSGTELSLSDYDESKVESVVKSGLAYYNAHKNAIEGEHETLKATDRITLPSSLEGATVTLSKSSYTYNGKAKKPTVSVSLSGTALKSGTDYTVSYSNNKNAGKATVTVTGAGNYADSATKTFTIKKAAGYANASKTTVKASKKSTITVKASGSVSYTVPKAAKDASITANGKKITVKKGATKGTYSIKAKVKASKNYKAATKTIKVKVA